MRGNGSVVVLDIETTGLSPQKGAKIIEIGAVKLVNGTVVDKFSEFINPKMNIPQNIVELTGITNEMVCDKEEYPTVLERFLKFIEGSLIVAHNAKFDWDRFLLHFAKQIGKFPENKVVDTIELSKKYYPNESRHNLKVCCDRAGITIKNHHRAIDDAIATSELFLYLSSKLEDEENIQTTIYEEETEESINKKVLSSNIKIRRVSYWQKNVSKTKSIKRLYVSIVENGVYGSVFLDVVSKTWYNKDFPKNIDFKVVNALCKKYLGIKDDYELYNYRN